ncbi:hypothetical protein MRX96_010876 [Rhipicephalus microplus]
MTSRDGWLYASTIASTFYSGHTNTASQPPVVCLCKLRGQSLSGATKCRERGSKSGRDDILSFPEPSSDSWYGTVDVDICEPRGLPDCRSIIALLQKAGRNKEKRKAEESNHDRRAGSDSLEKLARGKRHCRPDRKRTPNAAESGSSGFIPRRRRAGAENGVRPENNGRPRSQRSLELAGPSLARRRSRHSVNGCESSEHPLSAPPNVGHQPGPDV